MERLSAFSDIANVIVACASVLLAFYIFVYQREKDKKDKLESQRQIEQNLRLQWFKELIVQPNLNQINGFYHSILDQIPKIEQALVNEDEKQRIDREIKTAYYDLRRRFVDLLDVVDTGLFQKVSSNLEVLLDDLSNAIFNEREASDIPFSKGLEAKVVESQKQMIKEIYGFKGTSPSLPSASRTA